MMLVIVTMMTTMATMMMMVVVVVVVMMMMMMMVMIVPYAFPFSFRREIQTNIRILLLREHSMVHGGRSLLWQPLGKPHALDRLTLIGTQEFNGIFITPDCCSMCGTKLGCQNIDQGKGTLWEPTIADGSSPSNDSLWHSLWRRTTQDRAVGFLLTATQSLFSVFCCCCCCCLFPSCCLFNQATGTKLRGRSWGGFLQSLGRWPVWSSRPYLSHRSRTTSCRTRSLLPTRGSTGPG